MCNGEVCVKYRKERVSEEMSRVLSRPHGKSLINYEDIQWDHFKDRLTDCSRQEIDFNVRKMSRTIR